MMIIEIIGGVIGIACMVILGFVAVYSEVLNIRIKKAVLKFGGDINARINK